MIKKLAHPSTSARSPSSSADSETNMSGAPVEHNRKQLLLRYSLRLLYLHRMIALPPIHTEWNLLCSFLNTATSDFQPQLCNHAFVCHALCSTNQFQHVLLASVVLEYIKLCKHTLIYTSYVLPMCDCA